MTTKKLRKGQIGETAEGFWVISGSGATFTTRLKAEKYKKLKAQVEMLTRKLSAVNRQLRSLSI